jgi:gamma-glutamylaminecyclotransferase
MGRLCEARCDENAAMAHRIFVFGTLKQGFCNHHVNRGTRVGGDFVTVQPHALFIVGPRHLPWLLPEPGQGHPVVGQLFEVDDATLADMDRLERVTEPLWYRRQPVEVRPHEGGASLTAWVYFGSPERLAQETVHAGPVPEYTAELAAAYPLGLLT